MRKEEEYKGWDYYQRLISNNARIQNNPSAKKAIDKLYQEIEAMLDGPNDLFKQEIYLRKKEEVHNIIQSLEFEKSIRKAS